VGLDLFYHQLYRLFQLRVLDFHHQVGTIVDDYVGIDTVIFNQPVAIKAVQ
jgi:hypothetical protein